MENSPKTKGFVVVFYGECIPQLNCWSPSVITSEHITWLFKKQWGIDVDACEIEENDIPRTVDELESQSPIGLDIDERDYSDSEDEDHRDHASLCILHSLSTSHDI